MRMTSSNAKMFETLTLQNLTDEDIDLKFLKKWKCQNDHNLWSV